MHLEITKLLDGSSNPLIKFKNPISSRQNFINKDQNLLYFFTYHWKGYQYYCEMENKFEERNRK